MKGHLLPVKWSALGQRSVPGFAFATGWVQVRFHASAGFLSRFSDWFCPKPKDLDTMLIRDSEFSADPSHHPTINPSIHPSNHPSIHPLDVIACRPSSHGQAGRVDVAMSRCVTWSTRVPGRQPVSCSTVVRQASWTVSALSSIDLLYYKSMDGGSDCVTEPWECERSVLTLYWPCFCLSAFRPCWFPVETTWLFSNSLGQLEMQSAVSS